MASKWVNSVYNQIESKRDVARKIQKDRLKEIAKKIQHITKYVDGLDPADPTHIHLILEQKETKERLEEELRILRSDEKYLYNRLDELYSTCTATAKPVHQVKCIPKKRTFAQMVAEKSDTLPQSHIEDVIAYSTKDWTCASTEEEVKQVKTPSVDLPDIGPKGARTKQVASLDDEFEKIVDWSIVRREKCDRYHCPKCERPYVHSIVESLFLCEHCGLSEQILFDTGSTISAQNKPQTRPPVKRDGNFDDLLAHFEPEPRALLEDQVIDNVRDEIQRNAFHDSTQIRSMQVKDILKRLNMSEFYQNRGQIAADLNGEPPPTLTHQQKNLLRTLYMLTIEPFMRHKGDRHNSLNRALIFNGLCQIAQLPTEVQNYFPLLKSGSKLVKQIEILLRVFEENKWPCVFDFH